MKCSSIFNCSRILNRYFSNFFKFLSLKTVLSYQKVLIFVGSNGRRHTGWKIRGKNLTEVSVGSCSAYVLLFQAVKDTGRSETSQSSKLPRCLVKNNRSWARDLITWIKYTVYAWLNLVNLNDVKSFIVIMLPISTLVSKTSCRKTEKSLFLLKTVNLLQFFPSAYNYRNTLHITIFKKYFYK